MGSLANAKIPAIANAIEETSNRSIHVFADWHTPGPNADEYWRAHEIARGFSYREALYRPAATNAFEFDLRNMNSSHGAVLAYPAGKSAHMELGYMAGAGKPTVILLESANWQARPDLMLRLAGLVTDSMEECVTYLLKEFERRLT